MQLQLVSLSPPKIQDWTDERLTWDPEKFGNLTDVIVKADKLWLPELAVMNGWAYPRGLHTRGNTCCNVCFAFLSFLFEWPYCGWQDWKDERLSWDPEQFGNLSDIIVKADKLWLPELAVMNGWGKGVWLECIVTLCWYLL